MVIILAYPKRVNYFKKLLGTKQAQGINLDNIKNDGLKWEEGLEEFVITNKPKLILFDNDFSFIDFGQLWKDVSKSIIKNNLEDTKLGIFKTDYCRHFLPKEGTYLYIGKIEELEEFT